jgi:aspartyl-tRNA(Asn)/glutamyl-tRNA(Gln) amidotransferase subunit A
MKPLADLAADLASGRTTSRALLETCLARIGDPAGEGARAFLFVDAARARAEADASDRARAAGQVPSPMAGIPISVKDLIDVAGQVTRAGSRVLSDAAPAARDAPLVSRLRTAGAVIVGRTNTVEFAFSGVGINPHYGTPRNPWDRATGRIPGGSSSGAAVSVADGMAAAGIGTDTGGSVRIPAALCGLTGFKPTVGRIPTEGVFPLSTTLDSVGPIGHSVACCALLDAVLADLPSERVDDVPVAGLRLGLVRDARFEDLDPVVARAFERAIDTLAAAGARVTEVRLPELARLPFIESRGGVVLPEAWAIHRDLIARAGQGYDPMVAWRVRMGERIPSGITAMVRDERALLARSFARSAAPFDALLMSTVPMPAPAIAPLEADPRLYNATDQALLRHTSVINAADGCALTLPCHLPDEAPAGLMLAAGGGADRALLAVGAAVERALRVRLRR